MEDEEGEEEEKENGCPLKSKHQLSREGGGGGGRRRRRRMTRRRGENTIPFTCIAFIA